MNADNQRDTSQTTNDLREFMVEVSWLKPVEVSRSVIIARSEEDAALIARSIFFKTHSEGCAIAAVKVDNQP